MKRFITVLVILVTVVAGLSAQDPLIADFQGAFQGFATAVAGTLASTATSGLNWSPAYIGQFPHFGIGVTVGATLMPYSAVEPVFGMLGVTSLGPALGYLQQYGVPLPAAAIDARLGGFALPFDIGFKIGLIPDFLKEKLGNVTADYFIIGGDVRFALLKDEGLMPALSVGVGYSYMKGGIAMPVPGTTSEVVDISTAMNAAGYSGTHTLTFNQPNVEFNWLTNVIEAKAQISKRILFLTPHAGISAAYGLGSQAGGGLQATVAYAGSQSFATAQTVLQALGIPLSATEGISVNSVAPPAWAFRVYAGTSISLLLLNLDVAASYNLVSKNLGGSVNLRVQL